MDLPGRFKTPVRWETGDGDDPFNPGDGDDPQINPLRETTKFLPNLASALSFFDSLRRETAFEIWPRKSALKLAPIEWWTSEAFKVARALITKLANAKSRPPSNVPTGSVKLEEELVAIRDKQKKLLEQRDQLSRDDQGKSLVGDARYLCLAQIAYVEREIDTTRDASELLLSNNSPAQPSTLIKKTSLSVPLPHSFASRTV